VATGLIGKLLGREREMTHLVEYDLLTGLRNRYATLQMLRHDVAKPENLGHLAILFHRSRQLQDRQRHARPQRRRHRAADDGVAAGGCGRRQRHA
jgi:GGDEF domain-containing protein